METLTGVFDATRRATLEALCDTFVPALESTSADPVERAFLERGAGDLAVAAQIEGLLAQAMLPEEIEAVGGLLDALEAESFSVAPLEARTAIVLGFRQADPQAKLGLQQLKALTILFFYALPDERGQNPLLGDARLPRAALSAALGRAGAQDVARDRGLRRVGHPAGRRLRGRIRCRRRRHRRALRRGRSARPGARDGRLSQ